MEKYLIDLIEGNIYLNDIPTGYGKTSFFIPIKILYEIIKSKITTKNNFVILTLNNLVDQTYNDIFTGLTIYKNIIISKQILDI